MNKDKQLSHLGCLEQRHAELDTKIKQGYSHYLDDEHLGKMKHEKLTIKRQIENLKNILSKEAIK